MMRKNYGNHSKKAQHLPKRAQRRKTPFDRPVVKFTSLFACAALVIAGVTWGIFGLWNPLGATSQSLNSATSGANISSATATNTDSTTETPDEATSFYPSDKLEGATETVDENGIVHGVSADGIAYTVRGRDEESLTDGVVSLVAVGDQIGSANALPLARAYGGGDSYDFTPFYQEVGEFVQDYDLRFISQETVMGGSALGYTGYPTFNTPDAAAEAIATYNFNLINFATNHIYDKGTGAIERSHEVWANYPQLLVAGSYPTAEERQTVHMIEREGITFAFLAYTYGDNTYLDASQMPNDYYSVVFDKETLSTDVERAQQVADVVIVGMHWGSEYVTEPNEQQLEYAKYLADLDVDLVLGTHAHSMQPVKYVTGDSGNTIPVVFGLGTLISGWTLIDTILSGAFTCDFVVGESGEITVENLAWYPLIEWSDGGNTWVRFLKDMDADEQNANTRISNVSRNQIATYLENKINSVDMDIPVIM